MPSRLSQRPSVVVMPGGVRRAATLRALVQRAGLQPILAADADSAFARVLEEDPLLLMLDGGAACAEAVRALRELMRSIGRAADVVVCGEQGGRRPRCLRQLKRRLRCALRAHRRAGLAQAADPAWQALLADYRADLQGRMAELALAVEHGDAARALALVHDVKGSAGGYGFGCLTPLSAAAQDAFMAGDPATAFDHCKRLADVAMGLTLPR